jgi:hypothetical protein
VRPLCLLVILAAVLALTGCGTQSAPDPQPKIASGAVRLVTDFGPELGPDGQTWQWIGTTGGLTVKATGRAWLTLRARSLRRPRTLFFQTQSGQQIPLELGTRAAAHVVGPFDFHNTAEIGIEPKPGPARASRDDPRYLSAFVSNLRLAPEPAAAQPTVGFYLTEYGPAMAPFNWLRDRGKIEVAAGPAESRVWLRFEASSIDSDRDVQFSAGRARHRVTVPGGRRRTAIAVGPFRLVNGHATVSVDSLTPPRRYGEDPRPLSVRVAAMRASLHDPN